jgi:aldose 1-epimerase
VTVHLRAGAVSVDVDETCGGRLASLHVAGRERLVGRTDDVFRWGSYPMAPWAGRVADARVADTGIALRANHGPHAMHGVVYDVPWTVGHADGSRVALRCALPRDRWPPGGVAEQGIALSPGALELTLRVCAGDTAMPAALGWHPWFAREGGDDGMGVRVDADAVLETTDDLIPTGATEPVRGALDLRGGVRLGRRRLDHCYVGVTGPVEVHWPDLVLELTLPDGADTVVVHTPDAGVCVEPQTAWTDPFARPERSGVATVGAGGCLTAVTTWTWHRR